MKRHHGDPELDDGFLPTIPPDLDPDPGLAASLLAPIGIESVQASLFDVGSMSVISSWNIDRLGGAATVGDDSGSPSAFAAMATIVQLNKVPVAETLARRLDSRRWAFAWHVDDRRVAVAEAHDRLPFFEHSKDDAALLRQICEAGLQIRPLGTLATLARAAGATRSAQVHAAPATLPREKESVGSETQHGAALAAQDGRPLDVSLPGNERRSSVNGLLLRGGMLGLLLLCLGAAAVFFAAHRQAESMHGETLRLQSQLEATMSLRLGEVLDGGDYGEVQTELESFALLKYFDSAVVTNARRRVVAVVGGVAGVRMGDPVPPEAVRGARVVPLGTGRSPTGAELMTWGTSSLRSEPRAWLVTGLSMSAAAVVAAAWLLTRFRRRRQSMPVAPEKL